MDGGLRGRDGNETLMRVMGVVGFGIRDWMTTRSQLVFLCVGRDVYFFWKLVKETD